MSLHENIKKSRIAKEISQRELGRRIEMSGQMISKIEKSETTPSIETLTKIAKALDVSIEELLGTSPPSTSDKQSYLIEQLIYSLGYDIIYDEEDGYVVLKHGKDEYEIEEKDVNDLYQSSTSFIEFKLQEIIKRSRKFPK